MIMWKRLQETFALFLVFISLASSDESCTIKKLTEVEESSKMEVNFWIKPESDFERIEIHLKVENTVTGSPYYEHKHLAVDSKAILDSNYYMEPYWIRLTIEVFEQIGGFGKDRLIRLHARFNQTITRVLDANLLDSQFQYQNYKLSAKGGLSFSKCNSPPLMTEDPTKPNTTSDSSISNGNSATTTTTTTTTTDKGGKESMFIVPPENYPRSSNEIFMIVLLVVIVVLTILLIIAVIFIEYRNKMMERDIAFLSQPESVLKGEDNPYVAAPGMGRILRPVLPPPYAFKYPPKEIT